jgi:mannose-6-phosphate isomerase-like protein (cupin superfamily)
MAHGSEHRTYHLLGYAVNVLVVDEDPEARFSIAEYLKPPGDMTPLHVHNRESQTTYVIEGQVTISLPDESHILNPGMCLYQPKGIPHTERISSETPARVLDVYAPAGFERFITSAGRPTDHMQLPEMPESPDRARLGELRAILEELGVDLLGPPGALP